MRPKRVVHVPPVPGGFLVRWNASAQRDVQGTKEGQAGGGYQLSNFEDDLERDSFLCVPTNQCIQLCASCPWAGRAHAGCSSTFINVSVFCHRPLEQGLTPAERFGATCRYHERWTKADRIPSLFPWTVSAKRNWCTPRSEPLRQRSPRLPPPFMQPGPTLESRGSSVKKL